MNGEWEACFARVVACARTAQLAPMEIGTSYGTPALKAAGRLFARIKDADTLVLACPSEEKEVLLAAASDLFFETDHYRGWPLILLRLAAADDATLAHHLARAHGAAIAAGPVRKPGRRSGR